MIPQKEHFSSDWWLEFQKQWNQQESLKRKFAGLGKVRFHFSDGLGVSVALNWDKQGHIIGVEFAENLDHTLPTFSATSQNWHKFINQELNAVKAVMGGIIKYNGSGWVLLKYGRHFDDLATVAQLIKNS